MNTIFESIEKEYTEIKENYISMENELNEYREKNTIVGYIYILENPLFSYMVKIGYAKDVEKRMKELSGSGMPDPFHCYAIYGVTEERTDLEVHNLIDSLDPDLRHNTNREFYEITKDRAYKILESIAKISGTMDRLVLNPFNDEYFGDYIEDNKIELINNEPKTYKPIPAGTYHNKKKNAFVYTDGNDNWTILKGSFANIKEYSNPLTGEAYKNRFNFIKDEKFIEDVYLENVRPSCSANFVQNHDENGWTYWYTEDDIRIDIAFPRK